MAERLHASKITDEKLYSENDLERIVNKNPFERIVDENPLERILGENPLEENERSGQPTHELRSGFTT